MIYPYWAWGSGGHIRQFYSYHIDHTVLGIGEILSSLVALASGVLWFRQQATLVTAVTIFQPFRFILSIVVATNTYPS